MRHFTLLITILFSLSVVAAEPAEPINSNSGEEVAIPVLVKDSNNDAQAGFISAEATPQRPDALSILRAELQRQEMQAQARAAKDGVFWGTTKRFPIESITFFIAIGGVTFNSMWIKSHGDPLQMERHIMSLKDPIAHLSFYSFMQAQGFYMNFHTKGAKFQAMDASTRAQMMRRLSYQGMAIGSLASSIVADLGQSVKMCVDKWIKGKSDEKSLAVCNQAWQQWTVRNKFTQYFPQVISMWAAQAVTELAERGVHAGFTKVTATAWVQKILTKDFLVRQAYKITAADVVTTFVGGGWVTKSIKFVGKVTRFSGFVAIDHLLSNYTYRPINNIIKPLLFDFDALAINNLWAEADAGKWDMTKISNKRNIEKFEKEIENYGNQMQQWRDHLNQDAETDIAGWLEMTKKILNQMDYAYKFYKTFADTLYETLNVGHNIHTKQIAESAATVISRYPLRTLPFYGVSTGEYKPINGKLEDFYLVNPNELALRQKQHVLATAEKFENNYSRIRKAAEVQEYKDIIQKLKSGIDLRMAAGLNDINQTIALYELEMRQEHPYSMTSIEFISALRDLRKALGKPEPIIYPFAGYSQAFAAFSPNSAVEDTADYSKWSATKRYKFNKSTDLMMYKLICGNARGSLDKWTIIGVNFFNPQFSPPSLVKNTPEREEFCSRSLGTNSLYSTKLKNGSDLKAFLIRNLDYRIVGDFRKPKVEDSFEKWWVLNAKAPIDTEFKKYDQDFNKAFQAAYNNFFDHRSFFKWIVDGLNQSLYLPKSLNASLRAESNLYMQILARATLPDSVPTPLRSKTPMPLDSNKGFLSKLGDIAQRNSSGFNILSNAYNDNILKFNYLEYAVQNSQQDDLKSMYQNTPRAVSHLNDLMLQYYNFIRQQNVNFDQYIAHSKKIDTALNEVLVLTGLKRVVTSGASMDDEIEDFSRPASSGTENSPKSYEDVPIAQPTYKQRMTIAAVKGLRRTESEIRRFIRMRIALAQSLEVDAKELMADWENVNQSNARSNRVNPFGGNRPTAGGN